MYYWRKLSPEQRTQVLNLRQAQHRPWHSPPHNIGGGRFLLSATCYQHSSVIGATWKRMANFENQLLETLEANISAACAWVVLPNHYHVVACADNIKPVLKALSCLHGRTSFAWNGEEKRRGRKVWASTVDTKLKSERHFRATINYTHHNPVKHGYAEKWTDWPFSSAKSYFETVGREEAIRHWQEYDISSMGDTWDP